LKKKPRFFCDNCGAEVENNAKSCPGCGRFFSSVRCPACGHSGEESRFLHGCPSCGYSSPMGTPTTKDIGSRQKNAGKLPSWIYIISVIVLLFVFVILAIIITR